jgi:hypothetical protein
MVDASSRSFLKSRFPSFGKHNVHRDLFAGLTDVTTHRSFGNRHPSASNAQQAFVAYADMEPHLCAVVNMGSIASNLFDCSDRELYDFAVHHLEEMLDDLKARYYALDFPL